jgi:hypothetical protein
MNEFITWCMHHAGIVMLALGIGLVAMCHIIEIEKEHTRKP